MKGPCAWVVLGVLAAVTPAAAFHRQHPRLEQVTRSSAGTSDRPVISFLARYVAFSSAADLTGTGGLGTTRQIFLRDQCPDFPFCGQRGLRQLTNGTLPSTHPSLAKETLLVFESRADLLGNGSVGSHIFLYDIKTNTTQQLTTGAGDATEPVVSETGKIVVFTSTADYLGSGAVGRQIYRLDLTKQNAGCGLPVPCGTNPGLQQVTGSATGPIPGGATFAPYEAWGPSIDRAVKNVAFLSPADPVHPGVVQAWVAGINTRRFTQVTTADADVRNLSLDRKGRNLAFETTSDIKALLPPGSTASNVYLADVAKRTIAAVTVDGTLDSGFPAFGGPGKRLTFTSAADVTLEGSINAQLFQYDLRKKRFTRVTQAVPGTSGRSTTNDVFIAFESSDDLLVNGSTGQQIFVLNTFQNAPPPSTAIGTFDLQFGVADSALTVVHHDLTQTPPALRTRTIPVGGQMRIRVNAPDGTGRARLDVSVVGLEFDPLPLLPELGNLCIHGLVGGTGFKLTGDGVGFVDCPGGSTGPNLGPAMDVTQKHDLTETDPLCALGCRENEPCDVAPFGGHQTTCAGPPPAPCGVCNGPVATAYTGVFPAGGAVFQMGLVADISTALGGDGVACTSDDSYAPSGIGPQIVTFTTGAATGTIQEANALRILRCAGGARNGLTCAVPADCPDGTCQPQELSHLSLTTSAAGAPFPGTAPGCAALATQGVAGVAFVGEWPAIDLPGVGDAVLQLKLVGH